MRIMEYDSANRLIRYNGEEVLYDADGNMTYGPLDGEMRTLTYDCRNRLLSAGDVTYGYDAENNRIRKETSTYLEESVVDTTSAAFSRVLVTKRTRKEGGVLTADVKETLYVYGQGLLLQSGEETAYYHYNHLGSTTFLTDENGAVLSEYTYGTYGELLSGDTTLTPYLYNGRCGVATDENGLYYMRQRYYNPQVKRFVNQDVLTGSIDNSQSLNRYSYVQGNPLSYTDPFGLSPFNFCFTGSDFDCKNPYSCAKTAVKEHFSPLRGISWGGV